MKLLNVLRAFVCHSNLARGYAEMVDAVKHLRQDNMKLRDERQELITAYDILEGANEVLTEENLSLIKAIRTLPSKAEMDAVIQALSHMHCNTSYGKSIAKWRDEIEYRRGLCE